MNGQQSSSSDYSSCSSKQTSSRARTRTRTTSDVVDGTNYSLLNASSPLSVLWNPTGRFSFFFLSLSSFAYMIKIPTDKKNTETINHYLMIRFLLLDSKVHWRRSVSVLFLNVEMLFNFLRCVEVDLPPSLINLLFEQTLFNLR
jgi:hypothetical protein